MGHEIQAIRGPPRWGFRVQREELVLGIMGIGVGTEEDAGGPARRGVKTSVAAAELRLGDDGEPELGDAFELYQGSRRQAE